MCIFTVETVVKNTRILVAPLGKGMQLTVYQNDASVRVAAKRAARPAYSGFSMSESGGAAFGHSNGGPYPAMVLPIPLAHGTPCLIDLSDYPGGDIFKHLDSYFPKYDVHAAGFGGGGGFSWGGAPKYLEVKAVGGYKCTLVPSIDAMKKVDPNVFVLPKDIEQLLEQYYKAGFGFLVCIFDPNVGVKAHPIAYVGSRCENGDMFIPTRHEHNSGAGGGAAQRHPQQREFPKTLPARGGEGFAWAPPQSLALHTGIRCDQCGAGDFGGTRWRCATCPDYDLCDKCHASPFATTAHTPDHLYLEIKRPIDHKASVESGALAPRPVPIYSRESQQVATKRYAEYDHEIFIYNGIVRGTPGLNFNHDGHTVAARGDLQRGDVNWNYFRLVHNLELPQLMHLERLTIKGEWENTDFYAAPI